MKTWERLSTLTVDKLLRLGTNAFMRKVNPDATESRLDFGEFAVGSGISDAADFYKTAIFECGGIITTQILVELDGLNSGGTAADIVGGAGAANCHIGQITAARNGTVFAGMIKCFELPTGGDPDIDLWSADEATGVEDTAVTALSNQVQLLNGGDVAVTTQTGFIALPVDGQYLYITTGTATNATYTAGMIMFELYGYR